MRNNGAAARWGSVAFSPGPAWPPAATDNPIANNAPARRAASPFMASPQHPVTGEAGNACELGIPGRRSIQGVPPAAIRDQQVGGGGQLGQSVLDRRAPQFHHDTGATRTVARNIRTATLHGAAIHGHSVLPNVGLISRNRAGAAFCIGAVGSKTVPCVSALPATQGSA